MARQGGWIQLEQSDMRLAFNMAKMAKEGFSRASMEETKYLINKPCAKVREEKKRGVEFSGHKKVKAAIQRHPAMFRQNQMSGCLPCQNGTAKNQQTRWTWIVTGARLPARRSERIPEPTPPQADRPPAPTGNTSGAQHAEIINLLAGYTYLHTALTCAEYFKDNEGTENDTDFDPDMLTDEG
jgi:hypothetical protein